MEIGLNMYQEELKKQNVSLKIPSIDECDTCSHLSFKISAGSASEIEETKVKKYQKKYKKVRNLYAADADRVWKNT